MRISSGYVLDMFSDVSIPLNVVWYLVYNEYTAHGTVEVTFHCVLVCAFVSVASECTNDLCTSAVPMR